MDILSNPYALVLILAGLLVGLISFYIVFRLDRSVRWIAYTMIGFSIWGLGYGIELTRNTLEEMMFWVKIEYIGLLSAPVCWLIFALRYTGFDPKKMRWITPSIFIIPAISYLIVLTNEWHHLHYSKMWVIMTGPFPLMGIEKGPLYAIQTVYAYVAFLMGTLILVKRFQYANKYFRTQTQLLILGGVIPILANILYQTGIIVPFEGLDITPFAFLFSYVLIGIAIIRFQLLDLKPIARDKILELVTRGVLVLDKNKYIIDYNSAAKTLWPQPEQLKIGQQAEILFEKNQEIIHLIDDEKQSFIECKILYKGKESTYKFEAILLYDKSNLVSGVLLLFEDITQEIAIQEKLQKQALELQQLNDLKDKFFSIISHDLKGPVFGVKELIHLTQSGLISQEEFLDILPEVSKNMEQVAILLENLLAWTSSQLRGEHMEVRELELSTLLLSQKNLLDRIAKEKNISIELQNLSEAWIKADKNMLELIIRNLISNALKFSSSGSKVLIRTEVKASEVQVCIEDSGMGISDENLKKLNSGISFTTRGQQNESGTGLGLILVREYIGKIGGNLSVKSTLGKGSTFCISLPLATLETQD